MMFIYIYIVFTISFIHKHYCVKKLHFFVIEKAYLNELSQSSGLFEWFNSNKRIFLFPNRFFSYLSVTNFVPLMCKFSCMILFLGILMYIYEPWRVKTIDLKIWEINCSSIPITRRYAICFSNLQMRNFYSRWLIYIFKFLFHISYIRMCCCLK